MINKIEYNPQYLNELEQEAILSNIEGLGTANRPILRDGRVFRESNPYIRGEYLHNLPDWLSTLYNKMVADGVLEEGSTQVLIYEYYPGQGFFWHIDDKSDGHIINILSLQGSAVIAFRDSKNPDNQFTQDLPKGSLIKFSETLRWDWEHTILPVTERRVSIMFRKPIRKN